MSELNFVEIVANGLKEHCIQWGYDWIEKLKVDSSVKNFRRLFFNITHLYYIFYQGNCYNVTFDKKENIAIVKRCGKDWDNRSEDAVVDIEKIIELLVV